MTANAPDPAIDTTLTELDELRQVRDTLTVAESRDSLEGRLRAIAGGAANLGCAAAGVIVVSQSGTAELVVVSDGAPVNTDQVVRRARLAALDEPMDPDLPALAFPFSVGGGLPLARLVLVRGSRGYPEGRERSLRLLGAQAARAIDDARLVNVAERRAGRLQRLQEVGVLLSRSLDERRIVRELARHVQRILPSRGVVIAQPDVAAGTVEVVLHVEGGTLRPRGSETLAPGIIADVARSGRTRRLAVTADERSSVAAVADLVGGDPTGIGGVLAAPMLSQHRLVGVVALYAAGEFATEDEELLGTIAAQAAAAMVNARLYEESQRERRQSEALAEIARAVGGSLRVAEVLQLIQRHAAALLSARGAMVAIRKGKFLHVVAATGSGQVLAGMYLPIDGSVAGRAVLTAQPVLTNDVRTAPGVYAPARELAVIQRSLIAPLIAEEGPMGALAVLDRDEPFTQTDAGILQRFADHVAIALVNARLYEEAAEATRELGVTFDAVPVGLVVVDSDGNIVRANARAARLLGAADAEALAGRSLSGALLGGDDHADWPVARTLAERVPRRGILHAVSGGRAFEIAASPHPDGGAVVLFDEGIMSQGGAQESGPIGGETPG